MDLRSGSFWMRRDGAPPREYPSLERGLSCEVLVVGAGLTGAVIAFELARAGVECAVMDRRAVGAGSTGASTALVIYDLDEPLCRLQRRLGIAAARRVYALHRAGAGDLKRLATASGGRIPWLDVPSVYLARRERDSTLLERELGARREAGFPVELADRRVLSHRFGIDRPCGLISADGAVTDPFLLTHALLGASARLGARIFAHTRVGAMEERRGSVVARTARGPAVRAQKIVLAGGFEALRAAPAGAARLRSTYAIATAPLERPPAPFAAWDVGRPYLYARPTADGRMIAGGADEDDTSAAARDRKIPPKARALARGLRGLIPGLSPQPAFAWAGTFAETPDGYGYVQPSRRTPGVVLALACGGNGMAFAPIAARLVSAWREGRDDPDASLFRFNRGRVERRS